MIRSVLRAVAMGGLIFVVASRAATYSYPSQAPVFRLEIPDAWPVEAESNVLHTGPKDGSVYLGLWGVDAETMEQALEGLDKELDQWIGDLKSGEAKETEINGIPFVFVDGEGTDKEGGATIKCSAAVFIPSPQEVMVLVYFGTPEAEAKHERALMKIVQSIHPAETADQSGGAQDFILVNETGVEIAQIFISAASAASWEEDLLDTSEVLPSGNEMKINFSPDEEAELWDIKVVDNEGVSIVWERLNLTKISRVILRIEDNEAVAEVE